MLFCLVLEIWTLILNIDYHVIWKVIGLGHIEGPYPGACNFQGGVYGLTSTAVKYNDVILFSLGDSDTSSSDYIYTFISIEKSSNSRTSKAITQGA